MALETIATGLNHDGLQDLCRHAPPAPGTDVTFAVLVSLFAEKGEVRGNCADLGLTSIAPASNPRSEDSLPTLIAAPSQQLATSDRTWIVGSSLRRVEAFVRRRGGVDQLLRKRLCPELFRQARPLADVLMLRLQHEYDHSYYCKPVTRTDTPALSQ